MTARTVADYTGLVTSEHASRPKFIAMVAAMAQASVDQQNALLAQPAAFDLDTAVGVQLDAVGRWVGLSRGISVPITGAYMSFDTADLGWDQGVWWNPSMPTASVVALDDDTYRIMLRAKIGANHWNGTCEETVAILDAIFLPEGLTPVLADNQDMTMTITLGGASIPALLKALLDGGYIPVRPAGVSCSFVTP